MVAPDHGPVLLPAHPLSPFGQKIPLHRQLPDLLACRSPALPLMVPHVPALAPFVKTNLLHPLHGALLPCAHLVQMNLVPRRDLLERLVPAQCFPALPSSPGLAPCCHWEYPFSPWNRLSKTTLYFILLTFLSLGGMLATARHYPGVGIKPLGDISHEYSGVRDGCSFFGVLFRLIVGCVEACCCRARHSVVSTKCFVQGLASRLHAVFGGGVSCHVGNGHHQDAQDERHGA